MDFEAYVRSTMVRPNFLLLGLHFFDRSSLARWKQSDWEKRRGTRCRIGRQIPQVETCFFFEGLCFKKTVSRFRDEISAIRSEILCAKTVIQAHKERPPESVQPQTQTSSKKGSNTYGGLGDSGCLQQSSILVGHKHHFTWTDLDISTQADYIHQTFSGVVAVGGRLENLGTAMKAARMSDAMYR